MAEAFEEHVELLRTQFRDCSDREGLYKRVMELGRRAAPLDPIYKQERYRVSGCQSVMYLYSELSGSVMRFQASSEALISNGLAHLLTFVYDEQPPLVVLKQPPTFLEELGIPAALSPSRANGLASLYLRMKRDALAYLMKEIQPSAPRQHR